MTISGSELRSKYLSFFEKKQGHTLVKSAPLVPQGDATLLFVNAGMVQFKDVFTGAETRPYTRATSAQKCVRAGGKHNDLENVGRTARHHTFFEMLGNFSFGDYFKEEACKMAWSFLTEELGIDKSRLTVTVFGGEDGVPADEDAERIWRDVVGVPEGAISRCGAKDNFWQMGDTGPCGPCTEIHYERGAVDGAFGGDDPEGDQVLEIWNLVFMQYDRQADGTLNPLPAPCVDTGMGLERLAMVMNGNASNYDTDLLRPLIAFSEQKLGKTYTSTDGEDDVAMRVIADHARTTAFLIADGVAPSNDGRGSVLRAIMRRAVLFGDLLGFDDVFLADAAALAIDMFKDAYPELETARTLIVKTAENEERQFRRTLKIGMDQFEKVTADLPKGGTINGEAAFDLQATHGFPIVMTALLAGERGLSVDMDGFEVAKTQHADVSRGDGLGVKGEATVYKTLREQHGETRFVGDGQDTADGTVLALLERTPDGEVRVESLAEGTSGLLILDETAFYGESGGQQGDTGSLSADGLTLTVTDTTKSAGLHVHHVTVTAGSVAVGASVHGAIDTARRAAIVRNHSATHLLHAALREVLGDHVAQKGSLVAPDRLRFDFSHFEAISAAELATIEDLVNTWIVQNDHAHIAVSSIEDAKAAGAMALFGEKYGDSVRHVKFGAASHELCGGTHVAATGNIGLFKFVSEGPLAAGVRRVEAMTGPGAVAYMRARLDALKATAGQLNASDLDVPERVGKLRADLKARDKEIAALNAKAAAAKAGEAASAAREVAGIKVLTEVLEPGTDPKSLRDYADKLRDQLGSGVVGLGLPLSDKKCTLLIALTKDLTKTLHAGKMVGELAQIVGGRGGGKPDFAQAGGAEPGKLGDALGALDDVIARMKG